MHLITRSRITKRLVGQRSQPMRSYCKRLPTGELVSKRLSLSMKKSILLAQGSKTIGVLNRIWDTYSNRVRRTLREIPIAQQCTTITKMQSVAGGFNNLRLLSSSIEIPRGPQASERENRAQAPLLRTRLRPVTLTKTVRRGLKTLS